MYQHSPVAEVRQLLPAKLKNEEVGLMLFISSYDVALIQRRPVLTSTRSFRFSRSYELAKCSSAENVIFSRTVSMPVELNTEGPKKGELRL